MPGGSWQAVSDYLLIIMVNGLIFIALLNGICLYLQNITMIKLLQVVVQKLRIKLFAHILDLPITHFY